MDSDTTPFVSVIVPARNEARTLSACLGSLRCQSYPTRRREVIVADNGSTDGTADIARAHDAVLAEEKRVFTCAAAKNAGIRLATGAVLAFMDADAEAHPDWLANSVRCLLREDADIVGGAFVLTHGEPPSWYECYDSLAALDQAKFVSELRFTSGGNTIARREVFDRVGLFLPKLRWSEDLEWGQRAHASGAKQAYCPEALMYHPAKSSWRSLANEVYREGQYYAQRCASQGKGPLRAVRWRFFLSPGVCGLARLAARRGLARAGALPPLVVLHNALKLPRLAGIASMYYARP